jgi:hypothetical protein
MYDRGPIMTEEERKEIKKWCLSVCPNSEPLSNYRTQYLIDVNNKNIPPIIFDIKNRITAKENMYGFIEEKKLNDFVGFVLPGGNIHKHKDKNDKDRNLYHARFNVFIEIPRKGCITYYDSIPVTTKPGNYVLSRSGIDRHWSDKNEDIIPRISLSFGYLLPHWKLNELCSNPLVGTYNNYPLYPDF